MRLLPKQNKFLYWFYRTGLLFF